MVDVMKISHESAAFTCAIERRRHVAWILILIADAGFLAWGAMAAALPHLTWRSIRRRGRLVTAPPDRRASSPI
jgi:hypothetical protein